MEAERYSGFVYKYIGCIIFVGVNLKRFAPANF